MDIFLKFNRSTIELVDRSLRCHHFFPPVFPFFLELILNVIDPLFKFFDLFLELLYLWDEVFIDLLIVRFFLFESILILLEFGIFWEVEIMMLEIWCLDAVYFLLHHRIILVLFDYHLPRTVSAVIILLWAGLLETLKLVVCQSNWINRVFFSDQGLPHVKRTKELSIRMARVRSFDSR